MQEVFDYLKAAGVYYIATTDSEGKPHLRPFGSRAIVDDKFYITMSFPKKVYTQILANPYVELATMGKDGSWIRIAAKAVQEESLDIRERIMSGSGRSMNIENVMAFELTEVTATIYKGEDERTITW